MKENEYNIDCREYFLYVVFFLFIIWSYDSIDFIDPLHNRERIYGAEIHYPVVNASDYNEALNKYFFGFNPDLKTLESSPIKKELSESNDEYLNLYRDARAINIEIRHCFDSFQNRQELNMCIDSYYPKEEEFSHKVQKWVNNRVDIAKRWNDTETVRLNDNDSRGAYEFILPKNQKNNDYFQREYLGKQDLTPTLWDLIKETINEYIN